MRGLFCLDPPNKPKDFVINGNENSSEFRYFELLLLPCNYLHAEFGFTEDTIHPECIADLDK